MPDAACRPLDILLAIDGMHPRGGGPPVVVVGSAVALAKRGHRVTILTTANPEDEAVVRHTWPALDEHGIALVFDVDERASPLAVGKARRAVFERLVRAADVVHIHAVWHPMLIALGRIARDIGVPYFVSVHGVFDRRAMQRVKSKLLKKRAAMHLLGIYGFLDHAAGVVFGSEAEAAESWIPSPRMRQIFVPNGAPDDLGLAELDRADRARLFEAAPAQRGWTRTLLCRSRIHPEKGIDLLLAAFDRVAPDFPDAGLLIAGLRQNEAYEGKLRTSIAASPIRERMIITTELTGPSSQFLYRACDLFVMPSLAEGFSMSLIEGLANARPLLITRYCHMPVVADAGAGMVVEPTIAGLADGLRWFLRQDREAWERMGIAARQLFAENYTWDHVARRLEREYDASVAA
ncbi:glycosyltransferase involved in cell wall biosynthesis [Sphingomonas jejuensis]|uniref:Glycosyltransferase involved in cell wall biosynthesis n=1 Tax=Sphingomonas jejuensis TaxID=904715 RepID=A0ABX0XLY0_9SPHN|nr:glycosyltransferase [Sphingomonas jejuensis]NJC34178.1 glycosyltransferase involved in cell wall biosynthesis [Sphingomonas jejuensis]